MFDGTNFAGTEISLVTKNLIDAKGFLEKGWCTGAEGKTADGSPVNGDDPRAVSWCMMGALMAANGRYETESVNIIVDVLLVSHPSTYGIVSRFNDTRKSVKSVLKVLDLAIAKSMGET